MKNKYLILFLLFALTFYACESSYRNKFEIDTSTLKTQKIEIKTYGKALFEADTTQLKEELVRLQSEFPQFLLADLNDPANVKQIYDFVSDTFLIGLNRQVRELYPDLKNLEKELLPVVQHFEHFYPAISVPPIYTYISGVQHEIPVIAGQDAIAIGIDNYLGSETKAYTQLAIPKYMTYNMHPYFIARDLAAAIYDAYLPPQPNAANILDEMVMAGKKLLFIEAMVPGISDEVLLRYKTEQLNWATKHEGEIWAFLVGDQLLYLNNYELFKKLFADGPFTQDFSDEAPARLGEFIGLKLIRSYADKHPNFCIRKLIDEHDTQTILMEARYKPATK
ncbi:MAG: hypothetical protein PHG67_07470 [Bacteroidales bacterium]|nr:hypothetical protein [Bacteroidales bacterium]